MKKIINYILIIAILLTMFPINAFAGTNDSVLTENLVSGIYRHKVRWDYSRNYAPFTEFWMNGQVAYCIEPWIGATENIYNSTTDFSLSSYTDTQIANMKLIGYYGYGYGDHNTIRYKMATQELIWRESGELRDMFYSSDIDGNNIIDISYEKNQIMQLVNNHFARPSFNNTTINATIGDTITIHDNNGVLSQYNVLSNAGNTVWKEGNDLKITINNVGTSQIRLVKDLSRNGTNLFYYKNDSQKIISIDGADPVYTNTNIDAIGGTINLEKKDSETGVSQGVASLEGAKYEVYKDEKLIATLTTDRSGKTALNNLALGEYVIKEIVPSYGYKLDSTEYKVTLTKDELTGKIISNITVYEDVIKRKVELIKIYASDTTQISVPEVNISFNIYNSKNVLVQTITTDKYGYASLDLPYDTYRIEQVNTSLNHHKVDDFFVKIDEHSDEIIRYVLSNSEIKARLKVIKVDERDNIIKMANIKFKIFDVDSNKYVCQTITYPTGKTICEYETDSDGILMTPYPLSSGNYRLEEIDQFINGYLWNNEPVYFSIGENSNLMNDNEYGIILEVKFKNYEVKGQLDIHKDGEKLIIEDGSYHYESIVLKDVEFGLYADEDIVVNGHKYYSKDELVTNLITDELGNAIIDNLPLGKYYVKELATVDSHVIDKNTYHFELKYKDQYTEVVYQTLNLENKLPKGKLEITKTDLVTSEPIPNTKICVFTEDDLKVFCGVTDEFGKIIIDNLFVGKFYILEIETATPDYILNTDKMWFEILDDGQIIKANMTNELIVKVPNTGITDSSFLKDIGYVLIIGGILYVIYDRKKK